MYRTLVGGGLEVSGFSDVFGGESFRGARVFVETFGGYPRLRGRCFGFQEARGCFGNRVQRKVGFWEAMFSCFGQVFGVSGNGFVASPVNTRV